jgi:hypothetical protein
VIPTSVQSCRYRGGRREDRGEKPVVDEVMLGQPDVIEAAVLAPDDLVEDFVVKPVGGLMPPLRIPEVVPSPKRRFLPCSLITPSPEKLAVFSAAR